MERGGDFLVAVPKPFHVDEVIAAPKTIHTWGQCQDALSWTWGD